MRRSCNARGALTLLKCVYRPRLRVTLGLAFLVVGLAASASRSESQVVNGSFEDPVVVGGYQILLGGDTSIAGWTTTGTGVERLDPSTIGLGNAPDGSLIVDLNNDLGPTGGGVQQVIATEPGKLYHLKFYAGTSAAFGFAGECQIVVNAGDAAQTVQITNAAADIGWAQYTVDFTATSAQTSISFANDEPPRHFAFIDAVTVEVEGNVALSYGVLPLFDQTKAHKSGSSIPIKLQLLDSSGGNVSSPDIVVTATSVVRITDNAPGLLDDSGAANPDYNFRYDADLGGYIFNLSLKGYATGTYRLSFTAGNDPVTKTVDFQVK